MIAQSPLLSPDEQARLIGEAWEQLPPPRPALSLEIVSPNGKTECTCTRSGLTSLACGRATLIWFIHSGRNSRIVRASAAVSIIEM